MSIELSWLGSLGLILDLVGASVISWDLWRMSDVDIAVAVEGTWGSDRVVENLQRPEARSLLRARRMTRVGWVFLAVGFLLQWLGASYTGPALRWTYEIAPTFWTTFWAVLLGGIAAGIIAVVAGSSISSRLERRRTSVPTATKLERDIEILEEVRRIVLKPVETVLELGRDCSGDKGRPVRRGTGIELSSARWRAVQPVVGRVLDDVRLEADIAEYFTHVDDVRTLNERLRLVPITDTPSEAEKELRDQILDRCNYVSASSQTLDERLKETIVNLRQRIRRRQ